MARIGRDKTPHITGVTQDVDDQVFRPHPASAVLSLRAQQAGYKLSSSLLHAVCNIRRLEFQDSLLRGGEFICGNDRFVIAVAIIEVMKEPKRSQRKAHFEGAPSTPCSSPCK